MATFERPMRDTRVMCETRPDVKRRLIWAAILSLLAVQTTAAPTWLAGDHHIHSENSVGWDDSEPPKPVIGGDAKYSIERNAVMARTFGLDWMVATDHGGPNHSKLSLEMTYPSLEASRAAVPEVIQFLGLELNTPGADHSSIIMPKTEREAENVAAYEHRFDAKEAWPVDSARNEEAKMLDALTFAQSIHPPPVIIAHHPSRSAKEAGVFGLTSPAELRRWNDAAPTIAVGMEGAPGHQAAELRQTDDRGQYPAWVYARGAYGRGFPTMGGFDQMTAKVGGFWDAMLGEGRRWWITANSDSHIHYSEGGIDFWPGEYSKTYVYAEKNHSAILEALRSGRMFVATGGLLSALDVSLTDGVSTASIGGTLKTTRGTSLTLTVKLTESNEPNASGAYPKLSRVDLISGKVMGKQENLDLAQNPTTQVIERFDWHAFEREGNQRLIKTTIEASGNAYLRLRGTSTEELEPTPDPIGEDPWSDLWFYANPIFIEVLE